MILQLSRNRLYFIRSVHIAIITGFKVLNFVPIADLRRQAAGPSSSASRGKTADLLRMGGWHPHCHMHRPRQLLDSSHHCAQALELHTMVRARKKLTWAIVGRLTMWALVGGLLLRCCRWPCPPTGLVGCRRLTVLLSTLLTRDLGRLRCCLWGALVRLPTAAGSWSLFLSLMLSPSLIAHLLPRLIPTPPPQETTSALRTPFTNNLSFLITLKTCSTRCCLPTGCV